MNRLFGSSQGIMWKEAHGRKADPGPQGVGNLSVFHKLKISRATSLPAECIGPADKFRRDANEIPIFIAAVALYAAGH